MSPFVITAKQPTWPLRSDNAIWVESEQAAVTIEEAQTLASDAIYDAGYTAVADAEPAFEIPEHGGTITFPDGTLVQVRRERWVDLAASANVVWTDTPECRAEVLDAFNSRGVAA